MYEQKKNQTRKKKIFKKIKSVSKEKNRNKKIADCIYRDEYKLKPQDQTAVVK